MEKKILNLKKENMYVLMDYETTGVDFNFDIPLEIGLVVFNHKMETFYKYSTLIYIPLVTENFVSRNYAQHIHKINIYNDILKNRMRYRPEMVLNSTFNELKRIQIREKFEKIIMVSDCLPFEWMFTNVLLHKYYQILGTKHFPKGSPSALTYFHHAGYDLNILYETGLIEGEKNLPHRALDDCLINFENLKSVINIEKNEEEEKEEIEKGKDK